MAAPFFYIPSWSPDQQEIDLDEDNSRHVIQVLRMRPGEALRLTDGKGALLDGVILDDHKKKCRVSIKAAATEPPRTNRVTIAISPIKHTARFEWFLEQATEVGVSTIIPLLCERTERQSIRTDRLRNILVSAMLQSQQAWLPVLTEPTPFGQLLALMQADGTHSGDTYAGETHTGGTHTGGTRSGHFGAGQAYIAHLLEAPRATASLASLTREQPSPIAGPQAAAPAATILIGPEGDFSPTEVETALAAKLIPVSLGQNRLRTETAGVVAATLLCIR
jgi:16S rRNA (uracil1498-N3)-methyltransferase